MFERHLLAGWVGPHALKEVADLDAELTRDLVDPPGADPIGPGLVFLHLLVRYFEGLGQLLLRQTEFGAAHPDPLADVLVDAPRPDHVCPY